VNNQRKVDEDVERKEWKKKKKMEGEKRRPLFFFPIGLSSSPSV
jgi:hypothetical protein